MIKILLLCITFFSTQLFAEEPALRETDKVESSHAYDISYDASFEISYEYTCKCTHMTEGSSITSKIEFKKSDIPVGTPPMKHADNLCYESAAIDKWLCFLE
jgi:hypothetical protein